MEVTCITPSHFQGPWFDPELGVLQVLPMFSPVSPTSQKHAGDFIKETRMVHMLE